MMILEKPAIGLFNENEMLINKIKKIKSNIHPPLVFNNNIVSS